MQEAGGWNSSQQVEREKLEGEEMGWGKQRPWREGPWRDCRDKQCLLNFPLVGSLLEKMAAPLLPLTPQMTAVLSDGRMPSTPFLSAVTFSPLLWGTLPSTSN